MFDSLIQLFTDPGPASFVNFTFLPKYAPYFIDGVLNTLALSVVAVLLAVIPALLLALMRPGNRPCGGDACGGRRS